MVEMRRVTVMTTVPSQRASLAAWPFDWVVILTAAWPIEPATGPRKLSLVAGVLPKHGVVLTLVAIAAGTGRASGGAATGVTVTTATVSTTTMVHGVTHRIATAMAGELRTMHRERVLRTCLGPLAQSKAHQRKLRQTSHQA